MGGAGLLRSADDARMLLFLVKFAVTLVLIAMRAVGTFVTVRFFFWCALWLRWRLALSPRRMVSLHELVHRVRRSGLHGQCFFAVDCELLPAEGISPHASAGADIAP